MNRSMVLLVTSLVAVCTVYSSSAYCANLYDESADAAQDISDAIERASSSGKHVMVTWGGNWCGWCHKFDATIQSDSALRTFIAENYIRVNVDSRSNEALMTRMGVEAPGVPYFTILDGDGKKVADMRSRFFVVDGSHDPKIVQAVLAKYGPKPMRTSAETAYLKRAVALQALQRSDKKLFVKFSTPNCGWCRRLNDFLNEPEVAAILEKEYVYLDIDQASLPDGITLRERLSNGQSGGGVPWYAVLDNKGGVLTTATGPRGNIGYPARPESIAHFMGMLSHSTSTISEAEMAVIENRLNALGKQFGF